MLFIERDLLWCDVCGKDFRKREYLGGHVVLFKKGVCLSVMFEGSTSEEGSTWEIIWMLFKKGFLLYCDIWGKACRGESPSPMRDI